LPKATKHTLDGEAFVNYLIASKIALRNADFETPPPPVE